jgi:hypothetical protein
MKTGKALSIDEIAEQNTAWRIANEIQTPLGIIISAGELLESYFERLTPDRRRVALEDILCAARQMNSAMSELAAFENKPRENLKSTTLSTKRTQRNRVATRDLNHSHV